MQNAPAMLAQKMMNRQAPYGPIGMVAQNMSGNKKGGAAAGSSRPVIGLKFDTSTATAGVTFSNSDTTVTNTTGGNIASAKANVGTLTGAAVSWYWEFTLNSLNILIGMGPSSFVCNSTNQVGITTGTISYDPSAGIIYISGGIAANVATAKIGDVIGFKLTISATLSSLTTYVNNTSINTSNTTTIFPNYNTALFPIWSSNVLNASATISNNIYEQGGTIPIGTSVTTIAASASVTPVADGKYDVYTFNASGTFTAGSTGAVRALVIAGGGGGSGAGAGAGGYQEKGVVATPQTYVITVGAGGAGYGLGTNSSIGAAVVSTRGGLGNGSQPVTTDSNGGSGGGASPSVPASGPFSAVGGTGIAGQGNDGGPASGTASGGGVGACSGGGGGAGAIGGTGTTSTGGNGGNGLASNITGTSIFRGGGGGGYGDITGSSPGSGGGGYWSSSVGGVAAIVNTGGGGGPTVAGGSGVVIIRVRARA